MGQSPDGSTYSQIPSDYILVQGNADLKDGWVYPRIWTTQKTKMAEAGDLIMSVRAPAGTMGKTYYDVVIGRGVAGIKGSEFIYQALVKMDSNGYWKILASGSTFESINSDVVNGAELMVTENIDEQNKIGYYLASIDHLITLHQSKSFGHILKAIVSCTLSWEQRKLGEMVEFYNGDRSSRYPNDSDMVFDGIPFINAGDLVLGRVKLDTTNKITEEKYNQLSGAKIQCGDIIYCLRGTLGKNAFVDNFDIGTIASSLVDIRPQKIVGKYLFQVLNSDIEYSQRILNDEGAAQPNLSAKNLYLFDIPIPRDAEQIKIAEYLELLDHLITLHQLEPFQLIFKAIAYRIIDYAKSKPPRCRKYPGFIAFINTMYKNCVYTQYNHLYSLKSYYIKDIILLIKSAYICKIII